MLPDVLTKLFRLQVSSLSRSLNDRLPGRVLARIEIEYQPVGLLQVAGPAAPGVKFGQFGDARLRPKNPFGMCEPDTGYAGVGPRF